MPRPSGPAPAVVVGLDNITGLQVSRLLDRRGIPVIALAGDLDHFCARTRVPKRRIQAPLSGEPLILALEALAKTLPREGPAFLLPCTDLAVLAISRERARLADAYRFVLPEHAIIERLIDKVSFAEHAMATGLPIPPTRILRTREDAVEAAKSLPFPAVVKPGLKTPEWVANMRVKAIRVADPTELVATFERARPWTSTLIAQEWVAGGDEALFTCNAYFGRDSEPLATFVTRKIRQWPLETGIGSLGVEARDDVVLQTTIDLFRSVGYRGLAYLEMKRDERKGRYSIIEPNIGRPTGRSSTAERGGVELLLTAYRDALGLSLPADREQQYRGVKWIYWRHDLQAAAVAVARGKLTPAGWLRSVRGPSIEAVASWHDPAPMIAELGHVAGKAWRSVRRRPQRGDQP